MDKFENNNPSEELKIMRGADMQPTTLKFKLWDSVNKRFTQSGVQFNNSTMQLDVAPGIIVLLRSEFEDTRGNNICQGDLIIINNALNKYLVEFKDGCFKINCITGAKADSPYHGMLLSEVYKSCIVFNSIFEWEAWDDRKK